VTVLGGSTGSAEFFLVVSIFLSHVFVMDSAEIQFAIVLLVTMFLYSIVQEIFNVSAGWIVPGCGKELT